MERILSYQDIHDFTKVIIDQLGHANFRPDYIAGFVRGGMIPAVLLSHYYECGCVPIELSLRDNRVATPGSHLFQILDGALRMGKNVLVVDDICDSGDTFMTFRTMLDIQNPSVDKMCHFKTAALQKRYTSKFNPDVVAEYITNDDWQIYPWEEI